MNKRQFIELLSTYPDYTEIWMSVDPEGNEFNPISKIIMPAKMGRQIKQGHIRLPALVLFPTWEPLETILSLDGERLP